MASVSSLYFQSIRTHHPPLDLIHTSKGYSRVTTLTLSSSSSPGLTKLGTRSVSCVKNNNNDISSPDVTNPRNGIVDEENQHNSKVIDTHSTTTQRREALFQMLFAVFSSPLIVLAASANDEVQEDFRIYSDDTNKFKIMIPQDWEVGAGNGNGIKSLTAFYPPVASDSNVSVLITGLGADFTRLESFGKVDEFAETLVSGLDRSWQRPPGVAAKLINTKAAKGFYNIEYTLQKPGESRRHIFSTIGIASNGWYNRLYTVTGQYVEEEAEKYRSKIEKSVSSFKFT